MLKNLINTKLENRPIDGFDIHLIKKYEDISSEEEEFRSENLSILLIRSGGFKLKLEEVIQDLSARDLIIIPKDSDCNILETRV